MHAQQATVVQAVLYAGEECRSYIASHMSSTAQWRAIAAVPRTDAEVEGDGDVVELLLLHRHEIVESGGAP